MPAGRGRNSTRVSRRPVTRGVVANLHYVRVWEFRSWGQQEEDPNGQTALAAGQAGPSRCRTPHHDP
jgi:hypothetical protein